MFLMKLYSNSPIWMQNVFTTLKGYQNKKKRFGKHYQEYLEELRKQDYSDYESLKMIQELKVKEIVRFAINNSSFYKDAELQFKVKESFWLLGLN